jgi:hypothetical protein
MTTAQEQRLDYSAILARILDAVDQKSYLTPADSVDPRQRAAMAEIEAAIQAKDFSAERVRTLIARLHQEGRIDKVLMFSALHVVAAHPEVADYREAARLTGEQEVAALELGGSNLSANLASVDRHRGVIAWLTHHPAIALDHFTRALERQHTVENLGNVLCCLLSLGEIEEAEALVSKVRSQYPAFFVQDLDRRIQRDPDLALLTPSEVA